MTVKKKEATMRQRRALSADNTQKPSSQEPSTQNSKLKFGKHKKKRRIRSAGELPMVPAGVFDPPDSDSEAEAAGLDEDSIEDSLLLLPASSLQVEQTFLKLPQVNAKATPELQAQPIISKRGLSKFVAMNLKGPQNPHLLQRNQKRNLSDGFVGSERLRPVKILKRKPPTVAKTNAKSLTLTRSQVPPVASSALPQDHCPLLEFQTVSPHASESVRVNNDLVKEPYSPILACRSEIHPGGGEPASWEECQLEPKTSADQTLLSDDVFYQLAAITAPPRTECGSDDESNVTDRDHSDEQPVGFDAKADDGRSCLGY